MISPRAKFASLFARSTQLRERAAIDRLVRFRELARDRGVALGAEHRGDIRETFFDAMRRFEEHQRALLARERAASCVRRSLERAGRNPSKQKRSVGKPATASAAVIADGPGIARTSHPARAASLTSS